ncbi:unnamed protein product [Periconia digitata]|uniref:Uncharacterized protein n=1 Tax=Periconia digitata TaxID=1303443 RepID=A0A9W4UM87_9PLEO|nr:unnamed protein product [Periconia digitata]
MIHLDIFPTQQLPTHQPSQLHSNAPLPLQTPLTPSAPQPSATHPQPDSPQHHQSPSQ